MTIVFLVPYVPIPRIIKRINTASTVGKTTIIFWDRGTEDISKINFNPDIKECRIYQRANEGQPLKRLGATFRFFKSAYSLLKKEKPSCIHVTKTDMLLLVWFYCTTQKKRPSVIYEVSDIHSMALNNSKSIIRLFIKKLIYLLERVGMSVVDRLIVTSESFWTVYYKNMIPKESVLFLPNTPQDSVFTNYKKKDKGKFRIGFIGKVRYKNQLKLLVDVARQEDVDVLIAGNGIDLDEIKEYSEGLNNVNIYGSYNYEKEISELYGNIDCVFSVYDTNIQNVQIALPNRLYEAAICGLPLIVSKGTELANIVERKGLGVAIEDNSIESLLNAINKLRDPIYRNQIELNSKKFYQDYRYESIFNKLHEAYVELTN